MEWWGITKQGKEATSKCNEDDGHDKRSERIVRTKGEAIGPTSEMLGTIGVLSITLSISLGSPWPCFSFILSSLHHSLIKYCSKLYANLKYFAGNFHPSVETMV
jgi:hypothetical protein